MPEHFIAFWNVENLFDVENSPDRPDYLQTQLAGELEGWSASVLSAKIARLAEIIAAMNDSKGPDALGVCVCLLLALAIKAAVANAASASPISILFIS